MHCVSFDVINGSCVSHDQSSCSCVWKMITERVWDLCFWEERTHYKEVNKWWQHFGSPLAPSVCLSLCSAHKARLLLFTASVSNTFAATHLAIVVRRLSLWSVKGESESFDQRIGREEQRLGREVFELFIPGDESRATVENPAEVELLCSAWPLSGGAEPGTPSVAMGDAGM